MSGITHRVAEERSLALHREVARRLRERPELLDRARSRVESWAHDGTVAEHWVRRWRQVLACSVDEVAAAIVDPGEASRALRQTSPFAGVIDSATRWRILRDCERRRQTDDP
jgi:hypothetical protein